MTRHWRGVLVALLGLLIVAAAVVVALLPVPHATAQAHPATTGTAVPTTGSAAQPTVPPYPAADCDPVRVLPFKCGTYTSTFGGRHATGRTGTPVTDPLQLSFTPNGPGLLLTAVSPKSCLTARLPVTYRHRQLIRTTAGSYGEGDCHGPGPNRAGWAWRFLTRTALTTTDAATSIGQGQD